MRNPFERDHSLQSIASGMTANDTNPDKALEIGEKILKSMEGCNALEYTFKKKDKVTTMNTQIHAKVDGEAITVDPQLLFQRLLTAAGEMTENIADNFVYELCNIPPSMFEPSGLP